MDNPLKKFTEIIKTGSREEVKATQRQVENNHKLKLNIEIKSPNEEKCLQAVDFVCWAVYRKIAHNDEGYYNLVKQKIVEESPLFP